MGTGTLVQWFDYAPYGSVIASTNTGTTTDARQYIGRRRLLRFLGVF
jgi:hypothetical protein